MGRVSEFPVNIVDALTAGLAPLAGVDPDGIAKRVLRRSDPDGSLGVSVVDWVPDQNDIGQYDPVLSTYLFRIEHLIKHSNEEEGRTEHAVMAKKIRLMLYRNDGLRVRLAALRESEGGLTERVQRWGVRQQRMPSNEINGEFLFLSVTEFWVQTETV